MAQNQNTVYVGNLSEKVTEDLLYELFLQAGPVAQVTIPKQKPFGFVQFKHSCSVPYVVGLLEGTSLFGKPLKVAPRGGVAAMSGPQNMAQRPFTRPSPSVEPRNIHPLTQTGRLPSMEPRIPRKAGRYSSDGDSDLRYLLKARPRTNDPMMPSSRSAIRAETPSEKDMEAIPDFLGSGFDPLYSSGLFVPPYQFGVHDERDRRRDERNHKRQEEDDDDDYGNHHRGRNDRHDRSIHINARRNRGRYHSSCRRKHL